MLSPLYIIKKVRNFYTNFYNCYAIDYTIMLSQLSFLANTLIVKIFVIHPIKFSSKCCPL